MSSSRTRVPAASGPTQFAHPTPGWSYPGTAPGPAEARNKAATPPPTYKPAPPRGTVEYEMGPGGGIGLSAGSSPLWLQGVPLLDRIPLPTMRSIADPGNLDIANAILTDGVTLAWVDEPNEMYGRALEITIPGAVTNKWIQIPLKPNWGGSYPKTTGSVQFRMFIGSSEPITVLQPWIAQSIGSNSASRIGYLFSALGGTDRYGYKGTFASRWRDRYRTWTATCLVKSAQASPAEWSTSNPEYETRAIIFSITTTGPAKFRFNRACSEQWSTAAIITQFDGAYSASEYFMREMQSLGWPGVCSQNRLGLEPSLSVSDSTTADLISAGWDIIQHISNPTDTNPPVQNVIDGTMTAADLERAVMHWTRAMTASGLLTTQGRQGVSHLQNNSPRGVANAVDIYRRLGVKTSRGLCPDSEWGIDIGDGLTTQMPTYVWSGWNSLNGRFNRRMVPASSGETAESRHIYSGSTFETVMNSTISCGEMTWIYFHQLQDYNPPNFPESSQSSKAFAASWKDHMLANQDRVAMLTASQVDLLTYDRPGDVYLRWDGAWVSRSSAADEDDRRVVL